MFVTLISMNFFFFDYFISSNSFFISDLLHFANILSILLGMNDYLLQCLILTTQASVTVLFEYQKTAYVVLI